MGQEPKLTVVKSEPLTVTKSEPLSVVSSDASSTPQPGVMATIGNAVTDAGAGAVKSIPETFLHLARMIASMSGQSQVTPQIDAELARLAPTNAAQTVGNVGGQIAQAILPQTLVEKGAAMAADAVPVASGLVRAGVRGVGNAAIAGAQGGDPLTAGVLGAAIPAIGGAVAPKLQASAEEDMVNALGPNGGTGPRTRIQLQQAKNMAPDLLEQQFGAATQKGALAKAKQALGDAKQALDAAWTGPLKDGDTSKILNTLQQRRDALTLVNGTTGEVYVPEEAKAADALLSQLSDEVKRATGPNGTADLRELKNIRQLWDDQVNWMQADPAKRGTAPIYRKAAALVRETINGTDDRIAQANADFSQAEKLNSILTRTTERPGTSTAMHIGLHYGAPAIVGGAIGGYEGGYTGAVEGAAIGATLGKIITTPAFRYVSGNAKAMLARALDSGDQTRIGMALTTVTSQIAQRMKGDTTPAAQGATATLGTPVNSDKSALQSLQQETLRQYNTATGSDKAALGQKLQQLQAQLDAIK